MAGVIIAILVLMVLFVALVAWRNQHGSGKRQKIKPGPDNVNQLREEAKAAQNPIRISPSKTSQDSPSFPGRAASPLSPPQKTIVPVDPPRAPRASIPQGSG